MVQMLFDQNIILEIFAGLCGLGLLVRFIVASVYKYLVKESNNPAEAKNKMLVHMKMKFETCYKLKIGVNNVDTFVDKSVLNYRFCGILLSTWDNFSGQVLFLSLLLVPIGTVFGVIYECGQDQILFAGAVGISASAVLILVDKSINLSAKKRLLHINLLDYMENFCKVRMEQEAFHPELVEQQRKEYIQAAGSKKQIEKATLSSHDDQKDELNRRREARKKKEEERKLEAQRREEEQKRLELARKEEEKRKLEERKQLAAKRREEEIHKLEIEREEREARRAELKKKAAQKQQENDEKLNGEKNRLLESLEEELKTVSNGTDMNTLMQGLEELAADKERKLTDKPKKEQGKGKSKSLNLKEEKLVEDVLKEFFA